MIGKGFRRLFRRRPVVRALRLTGAIGVGGRFNRGLDDAALAPLIERAFAGRAPAAVALAINSPGGAPVQSALIARRIRDLAAEKDVPVLAFCEDVAASGGYMLACAADEIFVDENSVIGSIGVISASFGFHQALERLGVERRVQTAGAAKLRLDPFQPGKEDDREWLAALQKQIHENFIAMVRASRGERLADAPDLFTGEVWLGQDAVRLGLADGLGRMRPVLRQRFGEDVRVEMVAPKRGLLRRFGVDAAAPAQSLEDAAPALLAGALDELERRALWARYGL